MESKYIYIGLAILYYVVKAIRAANKKKEDGAQNKPDAMPQTKMPHQANRPINQPTFDELLKQIKASKEPKRKTEQQPVYIEMGRNLEAENMDFDQRELKQVKKERKDKVKRYENQEPEKLETFSKAVFKEYDTAAQKRNPYASLLKNKGGLQQAFVMSEILNRKY